MGTSNYKLLPMLLKCGNPSKEELAARLNDVWNEFSKSLDETPMVSAINDGSITLEQVKRFMRSMRAQIIDGGSWLSRAASSFDPKLSKLTLNARQVLISHAAEEHRDFEMLDRDFVSLGGALEDIQNATQNVATYAMSALIMWEASKPNPFHILGVIFIVEGVGQIKTAEWIPKLKSHLDLTDEQLSFMTYHAKNDEQHHKGLEFLLMHPDINQDISDRIVRIAEAIAFLYVEQIRHI